MDTPFKEPSLVRSYNRYPGSGTVRTGVSYVLDLSSVSMVLPPNKHNIMVAPFKEGVLVRSYVRIPNSGTDRTGKSSVLDLSSVSTIVPPISLHAGAGWSVPNSAAPQTNRELITTNSTPSQTGSSHTATNHLSIQIHKLRQENIVLRRQNMVLRRQISLTKHLIKNLSKHL